MAGYARGYNFRENVRAAEQGQNRAPQVATQVGRYVGPGRAQVPLWDDKQAHEWGYLANVYVYAVVKALSTDVSRCTVFAGESAAKPETASPNSRLAKFLGPPPGGPNPFWTSRKLIAWSIANKLVTGRYAWEYDFNPSAEIVGLWPLPRVRAVPTNGGASYFSAFEVPQPAAPPKRISADRVFYDFQPGLLDIREPESFLQAARLDVSVDVMQSRYDYAFYNNNAMPAAVVVTRAFAEEKEKIAFQDQMESRHGGPDNAGRIAFLEANSDDGPVDDDFAIKSLGLSQRDAQAVQMHADKIQAICVAAGVPMSRLDASGRTFSNAGEESHTYDERIAAVAQDFVDAVNLQLAPRLGKEVAWVDLSHLRSLKPQSRYQAVGLIDLVKAEVITPAEARADFGLPANPDELGVTEDAPPASLQEQSAAAAALVAAGYDPSEVLVAVGLPPMSHSSAAPAVPAPAALSKREEPDPDQVREERMAAHWRSTAQSVTSLESTWERSWQTFFARQEKNTLARLEGKSGRQAVRDIVTREDQQIPPDVSRVFDTAYWLAETADHADGLYASVFASAGDRLITELDAHDAITLDLRAPWVTDYIHARAHDLSGRVTDTTYGAIRDQMVEGITAGEGIPDLAARIKSVFDDASTTRATTIARTEVNAAYSGATLRTAQQMPVEIAAGKQWLATRDGRTRDDHAESDGQVRGLHEQFHVGPARGDAPGHTGDPAEDINCRCAIRILSPAEFAAEQKGRGNVVQLHRAIDLAHRINTGDVDLPAAIEEIEACL